MLTYDQLQCIGAVIAARGKFPHLLAAVDAELEQADKDRQEEVETWQNESQESSSPVT